MTERDSKELERESKTMIALERAEKASGNRSSRTWDPKEWQEDHRFIEAMDRLAAGMKRDALTKLARLYDDDPGHLFGRIQLFSVALDLQNLELISEHAEWALAFHNQHTSTEIVCVTYRQTRMALPELKWSERSLVIALLAGDKAKNHQVVVDATKMLMLMHPQSRAMPRALLSSAEVQAREARPDLARATLKTLLARYPLDPLVPHAERRLVELESASEEKTG